MKQIIEAAGWKMTREGRMSAASNTSATYCFTHAATGRVFTKHVMEDVTQNPVLTNSFVGSGEVEAINAMHNHLRGCEEQLAGRR